MTIFKIPILVSNSTHKFIIIILKTFFDQTKIRKVTVYCKKISCNFTPMVYSCKRLVWDSGVTLDWNTVSHRTGADFFEEQHQCLTYWCAAQKSTSASATYQSPISSIDDTGPSLECQDPLVPIRRIWTVVRCQLLVQGGWGGICFEIASLEKHLQLTRVQYQVWMTQDRP